MYRFFNFFLQTDRFLLFQFFFLTFVNSLHFMTTTTFLLDKLFFDPSFFLLSSLIFTFFLFLFSAGTKLISQFFTFFLFFFFIYVIFFVKCDTSVFYFLSNIEFFDFFFIDSFSFYIIALTTFLYLIIFFYYPFTINFSKFFVFLLVSSYYFLLFTFLVGRVFHFYIFFEALLLPFFFLISIWGSNVNRIWAGQRLLFFTLFFSSPFFLILSKFFFFQQTYLVFSNFFFYLYFSSSFYTIFFFLISIFFFLAVKIPLFPIHIWLPEAHGEAPTIGSILLAGLLLKLGSYGFFRFLYFSNFKDFFFIDFFIIVYFFCIFSIFSSLFSLFFQSDFKKIIAYFSIAHISYVVLGLFTFTYEGIFGSFIITISHGLSATLLFFLVGTLYNQTHTRSLLAYSQLAQKIPIFSIFFFLTSLANVSLPGTTGFVGEQLVLFSLFNLGFEFCFLPVLFTILSGFTGILFLFKLLFSSKTTSFVFFDLSIYEFFLALSLTAPIFFFGFFPNYLFLKYFKNVFCTFFSFNFFPFFCSCIFFFFFF